MQENYEPSYKNIENLGIFFVGNFIEDIDIKARKSSHGSTKRVLFSSETSSSEDDDSREILQEDNVLNHSMVPQDHLNYMRSQGKNLNFFRILNMLN